jgi:hypothetical protein
LDSNKYFKVRKNQLRREFSQVKDQQDGLLPQQMYPSEVLYSLNEIMESMSLKSIEKLQKHFKKNNRNLKYRQGLPLDLVAYPNSNKIQAFFQIA